MKKNKSGKRQGIIIAVVILAIIIIGVFVYFRGDFVKNDRLDDSGKFNQPNSSERPFNQPPNMQLNETQIQEVTSFFDSATDSEEIQKYCQSNRNSCMYYCSQVNQSNEFCSQMQPNREPRK